MADINQVSGLTNALASKVGKDLLSETGLPVASGADVATLEITTNSLVGRNSGGLTSIPVAEGGVVGRTAGGVLSTIPFSTLKSALAVSPGDIPLSLDNVIVGNGSGIGVATALSAIPLSKLGAPTAHLDMGAFRVSSTAAPTDPSHLTNKAYVDAAMSLGSGAVNASSLSLQDGYLIVGNSSNVGSATAKSNIPLSGFGVPTADISLGTYGITTTKSAFSSSDLVTRSWVEGAIAAIPVTPAPALGSIALASGSLVRGSVGGVMEAIPQSALPLSGFGSPTSDISLGGYTLTTTKVLFNSSDLVPKAYVDLVAGAPTTATNLDLVQGSILVGGATNKAEAFPLSSIPLSNLGSPTANLNFGAFTASTSKTAGFANNELVPLGHVNTLIATAASAVPLASGQLFVGNGSNVATATAKSAIGLAGFGLATGNFVVGDGSGVAVATAKSAIPLSGFGAATADISLGGYTLTTTKVTFGATDLINKTEAQAIAATAATVSALRPPEVFSATNGSMTLATLSNTPVQVYVVFHNMMAMVPGVDYTVSGNNIVATSAYNVSLGGVGTDGLGFESTDSIVVLYR